MRLPRCKSIHENFTGAFQFEVEKIEAKAVMSDREVEVA
jgi:hypothetical protein